MGSLALRARRLLRVLCNAPHFLGPVASVKIRLYANQISDRTNELGPPMTSQTDPTVEFLQGLKDREQQLRDGEIERPIYDASRGWLLAQLIARLIEPHVTEGDRDNAATLVRKSALRDAVDHTVAHFGITGMSDAGTFFAWLAEALRISPQQSAKDWQRWDALVKSGSEAIAMAYVELNGLQNLPPQRVFRDPLTSGGEGPEMVVIPAGQFIMGRPEVEEARIEYRGPSSPQGRVAFSQPFALARYAITVEQWRHYLANTGVHIPAGAFVWQIDGRVMNCRQCQTAGWEYPGFAQDSRHPVVCVSWHDARAYCQWLSDQTGESYFLPSEAQWEYACRAGTQTTFHFGETIDTTRANYDGTYAYGDEEPGVFRRQTVEVGSLKSPNAWGLHDMHGNVDEWCEDEWDFLPDRPPTDGRARPGDSRGDTSRRSSRGGSWVQPPVALTSASRSRGEANDRVNTLGFRVARKVEA